jgi:hypothetical protein
VDGNGLRRWRRGWRGHEHPHSTSVLCVSLRGRVQVPKHRVALIGTLIMGVDRGPILLARRNEDSEISLESANCMSAFVGG